MAKRSVKKSRKIEPGEKTGAQVKNSNAQPLELLAKAMNVKNSGEAFVSVKADERGFPAPGAGTYAKYREMSKQPTIALIENGIVYPPVQSNAWAYSKRGTGGKYKRMDKKRGKELAGAVPSEWVQWIQDVMDPLRDEIVRSCLLANRFGWAPAELVWDRVKGQIQPTKFKPLLWDISKLLFDGNGNVMGVSNEPPDEKDAVELTGPNAFVYTFGAVAGEPYGEPRHENCRREYDEAIAVRKRLAQYLKKQATIIPVLSHPDGTSLVNGAEYANEWIALRILERASQGDGVALKNKFASIPDLETALKLAGMSDWVLSYLNPGPGDHTGGILNTLKTYDIWFSRAWLVPERVALEAEKGSRADSKEHTSTATINAVMLDQNIAEAVNRQIVNTLLTMRFGPDAKDAVYIDPPPIEDNAIQGIVDLLKTEMLNPVIGPWLASVMNQTGLLDRADFPINEAMRDKTFTPPPPAPAPGSGGTPPAPGRLSGLLEGGGNEPPKPNTQKINERLQKKQTAAAAAKSGGNGKK